MSLKKQEKKSLVVPEKVYEDDFDATLRPKSFEEFTGQKKIVDNLRIFIQAARKRKEPLDHVLLTGPPDLVKQL